MRKPIHVNLTKPQSLRVRLGTGIEAYVYGSVIKGTATEDSDLDVYVAGPNAAKIEARYAFRRPLVLYQGKAYGLHVIGHDTADLRTFLESQPEAQRVF